MLGRLLFTDPLVASLLHRTTATLTDAAATSSTVGSSVTEALSTAATVSPATPPSNGSSRRRRSSSGRLSFKVSYLVDSCGLTPAAAALKRISLDTPEGPDAVLALLRAHDFAKSDIAKLVDASPSLLLHDAEADLRPKLEFYLQLGFSPPALVKFICRNVYALKADLETKIIPYVDFLRAVAGTDGRVVGALRRCPNLLGHNLRSLMESKIECLKCHGVPDSNISMLFVVLARVMVHRTDRFIRAVDKVSEMGYDPSATSFLRAVSLVCGTSTSTWEKKLEVYRSLGWSKAEVILAFKRQPNSMGMSEQKLRKVTRFFKDVFNWGPAFIARHATLLSLSFEKRVLPRASVLRLLESRKLLRRKPTATAFYILDIAFWEVYVEPYQKDVPEVLEAYSETTLRLEALMGDLEDASLSLIGQNARITLLPYGSDLSCPIVRALHGALWKQKRLLFYIKTIEDIEKILATIAKDQPQWTHLQMAVDLRVEKTLAVLRPQVLIDHRSILASIGWPPPLSTSILENGGSVEMPNPRVMMKDDKKENYSESFLALLTLQVLQANLEEGSTILRYIGRSKLHKVLLRENSFVTLTFDPRHMTQILKQMNGK